MKKVFKIIAVILSSIFMITTINCFAYTVEIEKTVMENGEKYRVKVYSVTADEEKTFIESLEDRYTADGIIYTLTDIKKDGGDVIDKKEITTTKQIITNTNNKEQILSKLLATLEYNENGYLGQYELNKDNLEIVSHYNGYTEYLIEENRRYSDLERNDIDFIPKQIIKDGIKLDLLETNWQVQTTINIGDTEIPDKYIANCYYAGKIKKDNPYTYTVTAMYLGIAEKVEAKPYTYTIFYKMEETKEINKQENSKITLFPAVGVGGMGLIIVVCFILRKNAKIYNLQYGHWKLVGKIFVNKPKINLTKFSSSEVTNRYKIELSKGAVNKLNKDTIQVIKGSNIVEHKLKNVNEQYTFEVTI